MLHTADDISFTSSSEPSLNWSHLEPFKIPLEDIVLVHPLAAGAYGEVWLGQYHHQRVAIKTCLASRASRKHLQSFINELSLIGSLQSRHIVKLLGAGWFRPTDLLAVLEYMNLGDLREYLNDHHPGPDHHSKQTLDKVKVAMSIANALAYLHAKRIIHRDLKSRNVLLDDTKGAKLADFGIARTYSVDETMSTAAAGTYRWMAPEVLMFKQYTIAVDVYSFGVVLSELDTHAVPYSHVRNDKGHAVSDTALLAMVLYHNLRPTFSATCPPWLSELALKCMDSDPAQRPEPAEIVAILNAQMMSSMSATTV
ncbi:hypothetical protein DYB34_013336 [Aphanomyces astaci]|uniref:Protein kinase domain-containing protein n=1 Tax=Aphanomyces astaci TaxID=112090 RepID=A0A3R7APW0_APHAT|nr:hypothetical protein DYB34_013336 [Aphanomyces astaci]